MAFCLVIIATLEIPVGSEISAVIPEGYTRHDVVNVAGDDFVQRCVAVICGCGRICLDWDIF